MMHARLVNQVREAHGGSRLRGRLVVVVMTLALPLLALGVPLAGSQESVAAATGTPTPCPPATPTSGSSTSSLCVAIGEYDIYFKPNVITIPADTPVRVSLDNHGAAPHNFSVTDHENSGLQNLNISLTLDPGKTGDTTINAPEGTYYFFCNQPGHEAAGMRGYLEVKKDAEITTSEATVTPRAG